ncbi:MAG: 3-deoxy-7-phosphoheptulonate synthase [Verrucomicrobia bacterium]|nr:3-deoxy-7-phosphoheptulonate synthase [Verrucomicrobiota bacterium]MBS0645619.1 3-deoxy-7-phosphoheptulonate synthase [Verrucomicrobiota bacterium]
MRGQGRFQKVGNMLSCHSSIMISHNTAAPFVTPLSLKQKIIQTNEDQIFITQSRKTIKNIFKKRDSRLLLLVGPCSIHDIEATLEYGRRLKQLSEDVKDKIFIVMRAYVEKPRTSLGWKGFFYDPYLDGSYAIETGALQTRQLFSSLTKWRLPLGAELLEPATAPFYADFLSWGCIGARTSASPPHRQFASGLPFAMGFKNSIDGNLDIAVQGSLTASQSHVFLGLDAHGQLVPHVTKGNTTCHIILRGSEQRPNYFPEDLAQAVQKCQQADVCSQVMIDCSHGNSSKQHLKQSAVFQAVLEQRLQGNSHLVACMLESFLEEGSQPIHSDLKWGVSVTDACLSWKMTEELIQEAYHALPTISVSEPIMV